MNEKIKLILSSTGEEVKMGDMITFSEGNGDFRSKLAFTLTPITYPICIQYGVIKEVRDSEVTTYAGKEISVIMERLAAKLGWKVKKVESILNSIEEINPSAAFSIMLKEFAIMLDEEYSDHIEKSEEIYIISTFDGRIHPVNKKHIKNYRNFAAFRTIEDAKYACKVFKDPIKQLFKSGKPKD